MKQYILTPSMSKRLIGMGMAAHPQVKQVLSQGTLAIIAGTTNGYVAEEVLKSIGQLEGFSRTGFRRGMVTPPDFSVASVKAEFAGDVIITDGAWRKGATIFDVADDLKKGDLVLKGANALDMASARAAVHIGHPQAGTVGAIMAAVAGRRVSLIAPVGLEKRIMDDVAAIADMINRPENQGPGMLVLPGEVFTELDAIELLSGASAIQVAGGGVYGAEGAIWVAVEGDDKQSEAAAALITRLSGEPACEA